MKAMKTLRFNGGDKERLKVDGLLVLPGEEFDVTAARADQLLANPFVKVSMVRSLKPVSAPKPADESEPAGSGGTKQEGDDAA
jgi:hypothetical protein